MIGKTSLETLIIDSSYFVPQQDKGQSKGQSESPFNEEEFVKDGVKEFSPVYTDRHSETCTSIDIDNEVFGSYENYIEVSTKNRF